MVPLGKEREVDAKKLEFGKISFCHESLFIIY